MNSNHSTRTVSLYIIIAMLACNAIPAHAMEPIRAGLARYKQWTGAAQNQLFTALKNYDVDGVREAIRAGADVNRPIDDPMGIYSRLLPLKALFRKMSIRYPLNAKAVEAAMVLLNNGAEPNMVIDLEGLTALHVAMRDDNIPLMELLLEKGAAVDATMPNGNTALDLAVRSNNVVAVMLLLGYGASHIDYSRYHYYRTSSAAAAQSEAGEIGNLLEIAGFFGTQEAKLMHIIGNLSPVRHARALYMMQERVKHTQPTGQDAHVLVALGDKSLLVQSIAGVTHFSDVVSEIVSDYANPLYQEKVQAAQEAEEVYVPEQEKQSDYPAIPIMGRRQEQQKKSTYETEPGVQGLDEQE